uniref:Diacylglycerol acyltransferase n=2 Tax=Panagrolaimus sp. JU765 TaxID=591449 RepID=A0AC34QJM0_9BILA
MGMISSDAASIEYALTMEPQSRAVAIVPGGAEESLDSHSYNYDLTLKERKGFVKLAIKTGASLVPVYQFGETGTYHQIPNERGSFVRRVQQTIKNATGISPIIVSGAGFFNNYFGIIPKKVKITTVVGAPIHITKNPNPTKEEITHVHDRYVAALVNLFEDNKKKYRVPEQAQLRIL